MKRKRIAPKIEWGRVNCGRSPQFTLLPLFFGQILNLRPLIFLVLGALLLSGCSFVRIQNVATGEVRVQVRVPDSGAAYTRQVSSGGIVEVFSSHGGRYTVTMLPNEQYREILLRLQSQITDRLFSERATLTVQEVGQLVENLNHIAQLLDELSEPMPSCSGYLPDYDTSIVTISMDFVSNEWILACS